MNHVSLMGRLTRDPDLRMTKSQKTVVSFTLAVGRPFKDKDGSQECDYISCIAWNERAEAIGKYVTKGQRLIVDGSIRTRNYEAKDGSKRFVTEVFVENFEFVEKKDSGESAIEDVPDIQF